MEASQKFAATLKTMHNTTISIYPPPSRAAHRTNIPLPPHLFSIAANSRIIFSASATGRMVLGESSGSAHLLEYRELLRRRPLLSAMLLRLGSFFFRNIVGPPEIIG
jgi:hypothetical protein